jgi:hypothetical protein
VFHNDYTPELKALGLTHYAVSIPGSEYGFALGHIGVFPVQYDPRAPQLGAPDWEVWPWTHVDAPTYFPIIHSLPGQPLVVVNHPRLPPDLGYFYNLKWEPGMPLPAEGMFDGLEVLSGYQDTPAGVTPLLRDWFYLLNRGQRVTGVGNSDTHRLDYPLAGYPRTFLRLPTEQPEQILPTDIRDAMLGMQAIATNGPLVHIKVDGPGLGELVGVVGGKVTVDLWADAPAWVDLTRVLLYQIGQQVAELPIPTRNHPALRTSVDVPVSEDGWLLAIAAGDTPLDPDIVGRMAAMAVPIGFTNPVWLDADGDGKVTPSRKVPPLPAVFDARSMAAAQAEQAAPRILETPLHAPLDCEPADWPLWLR